MNPSLFSRRDVLAAGALLAAGVVPSASFAAAPTDDFSFLLLGDIHFDKLTHHDMEWLKRDKPNDVGQVENYSRITRDIFPALMSQLKSRINDKNENITQIVHIGDLVEGLAGTPEKARLQNKEAVDYIKAAKLGRPFLFCKGNHDVTGPGAVDACNDILLPFVAEQAQQEIKTGNFALKQKNCLFAYYDAYDSKNSLSALEATLAKRTEQHVFVIIHPPVVPYGARSNWHILAKPGDSAERDRLLRVLGRNRAIVLCGHLHKYGTVVRQTPEGPFVQVSTVSVLPSADVAPKDEVHGVKEYGPDLVRLEPHFSPDTVNERRALLSAEAPAIRYYDYADAPGYGIVRVAGAVVTCDLYAGATGKRIRSLRLTDLLRA